MRLRLAAAESGGCIKSHAAEIYFVADACWIAYQAAALNVTKLEAAWLPSPVNWISKANILKFK